MNKILTICIPTYNRKEVLINEVKDYLSVNDNRFLVKVSDNCSTDGTQEALKTIEDSRLVINYNKENLGSIPNWIKALSDNESEYLIFTLDKDLVDINQLKSFLDFLECEKPCFGYADLDISKPIGYEKMEPGFDNVLKMAYLDKHPSGYFYRRDLFEEAIKKDSFLRLDKRFDFPFEVINAELAVSYPSAIVKGGLITTANRRQDTKEGKTLSYDDSNIWFGAPRKLIEYKYYFISAQNIGLSKSNTIGLLYHLLYRSYLDVTISLRNLMRNDVVCTHYNIKQRNVSLAEMRNNLKKMQNVFASNTYQTIPFINRCIIDKWALLKCYSRIIWQYIKR